MFDNGLGKKYPIIECDLDETGSSINYQMANFISPGGPLYTQEIISEIQGLNFNLGFHDYSIYSRNEYDTVELFHSPSRASFWDGKGYIDIPINDFVKILNEWIQFLKDLPFDHSLSNR